MATTILVMIDGLDPEYLEACPAPNLRKFAQDGFHVTADGMMPSVTNVNNTSMVTGHYPGPARDRIELLAGPQPGYRAVCGVRRVHLFGHHIRPVQAQRRTFVVGRVEGQASSPARNQHGSGFLVGGTDAGCRGGGRRTAARLFGRRKRLDHRGGQARFAGRTLRSGGSSRPPTTPCICTGRSIPSRPGI